MSDAETVGVGGRYSVSPGSDRKMSPLLLALLGLLSLLVCVLRGRKRSVCVCVSVFERERESIKPS